MLLPEIFLDVSFLPWLAIAKKRETIDAGQLVSGALPLVLSGASTGQGVVVVRRSQHRMVSNLQAGGSHWKDR